jgi:hypothetical protein
VAVVSYLDIKGDAYLVIVTTRCGGRLRGETQHTVADAIVQRNISCFVLFFKRVQSWKSASIVRPQDEGAAGDGGTGCSYLLHNLL